MEHRLGNSQWAHWLGQIQEQWTGMTLMDTLMELRTDHWWVVMNVVDWLAVQSEVEKGSLLVIEKGIRLGDWMCLELVVMLRTQTIGCH